MPEAKRHDGRRVDRENETRPTATGLDCPADLDLLFRDLDDLLEQIAAKSLLYSEDDRLLPSVAMRAVVGLARRRLEDIESRSAHASRRGESAARIEDAWRRAMIEAEGSARRVTSSAAEETNAEVSSSGPEDSLTKIALADDLQRLLRRKVESGQFPSEESVVEEALRLFLIEKPDKEHTRASCATELQEERLPGPFIEDQMVVAPVDFPRTGQEVACLYLIDITRQPDLFPGE